MSQEIEKIHIKDLVLWTENPRDPIDTKSTDQDIADRAISNDGRSLWSLEKLFKKMGPRFDQSEIPTVAYVNDKPVVYDGNRRVLIGKIIHGFVEISDSDNFTAFDFPELIPCNVCDKETALQHVDRKHADSGSWKPLERDIFKHKHMGEAKSHFLLIEEATGMISNHPKLNQVFVKDEIFTQTNLHKLGFSANNEKFQSQYEKDSDAKAVLNDVINAIESKQTTTRESRGEIEKFIGQALLKKKGNSFKNYNPNHNEPTQPRKTRKSPGKSHALFGKKLLLKPGQLNNLYSDFLKLHKDKKGYSEDFPVIIRMGLRLLCEWAAKDESMKLDEYIKAHFKKAHDSLSKDEKTTLATQSIKDDQGLVRLLQIGAHPYIAAANEEQTIAMSLILGKIFENTHGK